ncbi:MAG: hypothetical protein HC822_09575 [Oscillochloris sp.]|nr:hypothetical protein [Oscillochloris sp.]
MPKKVILVVIDALGSAVVQPLLQANKLPNVAALAAVGSIDFGCVAAFPSITPAATASIITGVYPEKHKIMGDYWYDEENNEVAYFGADFTVIWERGFDEFFTDFLVRLNHERLGAETLYEMVERSGKTAASLNYLVFHGDQPHDVDQPLLIKMIPGVGYNGKLYGPKILQLGDFVVPDGERSHSSLSHSGVLHRYGFEDHHAAETLLQMARNNTLPDLTVVYMPDNDFASHDEGPDQAAHVLLEADTYFGELIAIFGSVEPLLREFCIIITGDHSQTPMHADQHEAGIDLYAPLAEFTLAQAGRPWEHDERLLICPNLRVAQIYMREPGADVIDQVTKRLFDDPRIDQVLWLAEHSGEGPGFVVATADRGRLHFRQARNGERACHDVYGTAWAWDGDLSAVDARLDGETFVFNDYPNAFERIKGALDNAIGAGIWVTARPGHEFKLPNMNLHPGGSHGSLHKGDSIVPLLVAGAPAGTRFPDYPRTIDIAAICKQVLEI